MRQRAPPEGFRGEYFFGCGWNIGCSVEKVFGIFKTYEVSPQKSMDVAVGVVSGAIRRDGSVFVLG